MEHFIEMGSVGRMYIRSFIRIGSAIQKLMGGIHRHTDRILIAKHI
jgi:hypothetical protein